jgi:hypothetical protein
MFGGIDASSRAPGSRKEVILMPQIFLCEHQLARLISAVAAFPADKDEREDYELLLGTLKHHASLDGLMEELNPADIPF